MCVCGSQLQQLGWHPAGHMYMCLCQPVPPVGIRLDCPESKSSGLGAGERPGDLPWGGAMRLKPGTGQNAGPGGPLRARVCVCTYMSPCACWQHSAGSRALSSPSCLWAAQSLSSAIALSPLNICWCDGRGAGLMLTAFKALLMLSKLEQDFDTDCKTSNPSCFSSPGKHNSAP